MLLFTNIVILHSDWFKKKNDNVRGKKLKTGSHYRQEHCVVVIFGGKKRQEINQNIVFYELPQERYHSKQFEAEPNHHLT